MWSLLLLLTTVMYVRVYGNGEGGNDWGYDAPNGPDKWVGICATGKRQSPIDIRPAKLEFLDTPELRFMNYNSTGNVQVQNTGHSVAVVGFQDWPQRPWILGGGLSTYYDLVQFHLHWADEDDDGSEHQFGALHYPLELHLVHLKRGLTLADALEVSDGLAVVAVFFAKADNDSALKPLEPALVTTYGINTNVSVTAFRADSVLPVSHDAFFRYQGSLTTPSCSEAVVWTLLTEPMPVSESQLQIFRQHIDLYGRPMLSNRRPAMPLNGRQVYLRLSSAGTHFFPATCTIFMIYMLVLFDNDWMQV